MPSLPDTELPELDKPEPPRRGRKPLPAVLQRERIEHDLPEDLPVLRQGTSPLGRGRQRATAHGGQGVRAPARACLICGRHCERHGVRTRIKVRRQVTPLLSNSPRFPAMNLF